MFDEWMLPSNTNDTTYRSERDEKEVQHLQKEGKHRGAQFIFCQVLTTVKNIF